MSDTAAAEMGITRQSRSEMALSGTALGSGAVAPARLLVTCRSYGPGHQMHWLQKEQAAASEGVRVNALTFTGNDLEVELAIGRTVWWRHHNPSAVVAAYEANPDELTAHLALTTLQFGDSWFNCADAAWPWEGCSRR